MKLSQFFISRPIFAGVLSALIFLAGLLALPSLPISEYPEVVPPTVVVRATYPGANPKVIAETVASPLEQSINGVEGMLYQSSQATADGVMTPLTFLGGSFYSIDMLPPFWRAVSLANPVVYLVSGFRWSFYGTGDVDVGVSLAFTGAFIAACLAVLTWMFRTGYRLKP